MFFEQAKVCNPKIIYHIFGSGKINLVIEMGLGATLGEWYHLAEHLSEHYTVLLYSRGRNVDIPRIPRNIAVECHELLCNLGYADKLILLAHSQGGLYAQQFARLYPESVKGIILLDPLSANDSYYKTVFQSPKEQRMSGFDKSANFRIMEKLAKLHLGFVIKSIMRKAPPFYYYHNFSTEAERNILQELTHPELHRAALEEYSLAHETSEIENLLTKAGFPNVPLVLITHGSTFEIKEIMEFGETNEEFAKKVESLWQSLMMEYLSFVTKTLHLTAEKSGHYIHLTEPELLDKALVWIENESTVE
ncbi:MAG: alpha/beta hydrolase [Eubacteriales bacterium]|nr:alpha/beta hydrolase [Eubacteriales bacterium]